MFAELLSATPPKCQTSAQTIHRIRSSSSKLKTHGFFEMLTRANILKKLDAEIEKAKKVARQTKSTAIAYRSAGRSQQGDKRFFQTQSEMTGDYLQKLIDLKSEFAASDTKSREEVEMPCVVTVEYVDGRKIEFVLVHNVANIQGITFVSEDSPLGEAVLGKKVGDKFSYESEMRGKIEGVVRGIN